MNELKFKTNLKCGGCVAKVKPALENMDAVKQWNVDLDSSDKVLTVQGEGVQNIEVINALQSAGYNGSGL